MTRAQTFYASFIWESPFFKNSNALTRMLLSGWEVANIMTVTSGQTFPVNIGIDILDLGPRYNSWPDRIADGALPKNRAHGGPVLRHEGLRLREPRVPDA